MNAVFTSLNEFVDFFDARGCRFFVFFGRTSHKSTVINRENCGLEQPLVFWIKWNVEEDRVFICQRDFPCGLFLAGTYSLNRGTSAHSDGATVTWRWGTLLWLCQAWTSYRFHRTYSCVTSKDSGSIASRDSPCWLLSVLYSDTSAYWRTLNRSILHINILDSDLKIIKLWITNLTRSLSLLDWSKCRGTPHYWG